ncbi:hypothetical protein [Halonatronum saccharophilum]|uniref:hypothetical protein n=1 Tax=Halonatronum saccharophilum TaxID=150060 RepID=UPI00047FB567|nr:hypothetical protein [Halonatronum saccharophilum]
MNNLVALEYNTAKEILEKSNYQVQFRYSRPPKQLVGLGQLRVIGQRKIDDTLVELIVGHEDYR